MLKENHPRAEQVRQMLEWNGGGRYSSGVGIANIDFFGNVHADQFSMYRSFGNVKQRKFSEIWQDTSNAIMAGLKDRLGLLKGRCGACRFKTMCGGGLRARAEITSGDPWASDPGCYLTDEEIGLTGAGEAAVNEPREQRQGNGAAATCCAQAASPSAGG
jgi:radical SAM protein with 4Fe4S-binding SPASM domain